jgi:hypothetical protein
VTSERSLEGWAPVPGVDASLEEMVDHAFDYRGDVTVVLGDGHEITGYVYNRDGDVADPFLQMFLPSGASVTFRYAEVRAIHFTGKDTAAGKSYEAWLRRKAEVPAGRPSAPSA